MRLAFILALLCVSAAVSATSYTFYTPAGEIKLTNLTIPVSVNLGGRADLDSVASAYKRTLDANVSESIISEAKNETLRALASAKSDDIAYLQTPEQNLLLSYNECDEASGYRFCFKSIIYPEEDGPPLGDSTLNQVKIVNATYQLPVVITADVLEGKLTVKRTLSPTTAYSGTPVTVSVLVTNSGTAPVDGVRITDNPPLRVTKGDTTAFKGALLPGDTLSIQYEVEATDAGSYVFSGALTPSKTTLTNATLVVKPHLTLNGSVLNGPVGVPTPFVVTVKNTYTSDIDISSITLTADAELVGTIGQYATQKTPNTLATQKMTLKTGANTTLTGTLTPPEAGVGTLTINARYVGGTGYAGGTQPATIGFVARPQGLILNATPSIGAVELKLTSEATERIDDITIDWDDGTSESVRFLAAAQSLTLTHKYAQTATSPVTIATNATVRGTRDERSVTVAIPGLGLAPAAPVIPPTTVTPTQTPAPQQPAAQPPKAVPTAKPSPATPPAPAPQETEEVSGFRAFLKWFNSLFS